MKGGAIAWETLGRHTLDLWRCVRVWLCRRRNNYLSLEQLAQVPKVRLARCVSHPVPVVLVVLHVRSALLYASHKRVYNYRNLAATANKLCLDGISLMLSLKQR
jgi:hypothetical protein